MKRSKILLFFLIFTSLFFQQHLQQEANAKNLLSADNLSSNQSSQNSGLPDTVVVYMMTLHEDGSLRNGDFCYQGDGADTGCVESGSNFTYPPVDPLYISFANPDYINPLRVDVEHYYLYNVLPREMNVAENDVTLAALKAQALAARSIADWKAYKRYPDEFKSILIGIDDPISTTCGTQNNNGGYGGMSQLGALRWSKGNQCAGSGDQPWPVRWMDYRQILAHYYTGIDFLDGSGNKIAPDDRWNPLDYRLEDGSNVPPEMTLGQEYRIKLRIQNTSTTDWGAGDISLGPPARSTPLVPGLPKDVGEKPPETAILTLHL